MANVNSNVKLITTNTVPTTTNLSKGELAFGQVNGENKIFGNIGDRVVEFTASGEPIIYFNSEQELELFLGTPNVPATGWWAFVADKFPSGLSQFELFVATSSSAMKPSNVRFKTVNADKLTNNTYNLTSNYIAPNSDQWKATVYAEADYQADSSLTLQIDLMSEAFGSVIDSLTYQITPQPTAGNSKMVWQGEYDFDFATTRMAQPRDPYGDAYYWNLYLTNPLAYTLTNFKGMLKVEAV